MHIGALCHIWRGKVALRMWHWNSWRGEMLLRMWQWNSWCLCMCW